MRNKQTVDFARHYRVTVLTCQPADPAAKGGVESSVKLAKEEIVHKHTNLRTEYASCAEILAACQTFTDEANARERWPPAANPQRCLSRSRVGSGLICVCRSSC